jgi:hypothetical protein
MADKEPPLLTKAVSLVIEVANGRHTLSKAIPPLLLLLDAALCGLIIWKVPCKLAPTTSQRCTLLHNASGLLMT